MPLILARWILPLAQNAIPQHVGAPEGGEGRTEFILFGIFGSLLAGLLILFAIRFFIRQARKGENPAPRYDTH